MDWDFLIPCGEYCWFKDRTSTIIKCIEKWTLLFQQLTYLEEILIELIYFSLEDMIIQNAVSFQLRYSSDPISMSSRLFILKK